MCLIFLFGFFFGFFVCVIDNKFNHMLLTENKEIHKPFFKMVTKIATENIELVSFKGCAFKTSMGLGLLYVCFFKSMLMLAPTWYCYIA